MTFTTPEALEADANKLVIAILERPGSTNDKLGLLVLTAIQFIGAGAALLERLSKEKNGPELDLTGWAEEIMKMIANECKKQLRH